MNDILLSGLLNLFALFGAVNRTDKSRSLQMLSNYLTKHFGVRMLDDYLPLYSDLRDFYDISPELDKDAIIEGICSNIKHKISREDQTLMLLRLMEFCDPTPGSGKGESIAEENMQIFRRSGRRHLCGLRMLCFRRDQRTCAHPHPRWDERRAAPDQP